MTVNINSSLIVGAFSLPFAFWLGKRWIKKEGKSLKEESIPQILHQSKQQETLPSQEIVGVKQVSVLQLPHSLQIYVVEVQSRVFDFLPYETQAAYKRTCRGLYSFSRSLDYIGKTLSFIQENCDIIGSSFNQLNKRFFLIHPFTLGLGETHGKGYAHHKLLNAMIINLLWTPHSQLWIEGGENSLKKSKERYVMNLSAGALSHLFPPIALTAKSWDVSTESGDIWGISLVAEQIKRSAVAINKTQNVYKLHLDSENWTVDRFYNFLDDHFTEGCINQFWDFVTGVILKPSISKNRKEVFMKIANESSFLKKWVMDLFKNGALLVLLKNCTIANFDEEFTKDCELRDYSLRVRAKITYMEGRNGFFIAGEHHVHELHHQSKKLDKNMKYLCLKPKITVTEESVIRSYDEHFRLGKTSQKIFTSQNKVEQSDCQLFVKPKVEVDINLQIQQLLKCDTLDLNDNHFAHWHVHVVRLIENENKNFNEFTTTNRLKLQEEIDRSLS